MNAGRRLQRPGVSDPPGAGVTAVSYLTLNLEWNSDPLEEYYLLITTEPSLWPKTQNCK